MVDQLSEQNSNTKLLEGKKENNSNARIEQDIFVGNGGEK